MSRTSLRYTVEVGGRALNILSVHLRKNELHFDFKPAEYSRRTPGSDSAPERIEYERSTFHFSPTSRTGNQITRKLGTPAGEHRQYHFTNAIKTTNAFAAVFSRRFPDLEKGWPESPGGPNDISLGDFDPRNFQLVISVFAGNADREFSIHDPFLAEGINISEQILGKYKILILYSFYESPSIEQGTKAFFHTVRTESISDPSHKRENDFVMSGFDEYHVLEMFFILETRFMSEFSELAGRGLGNRNGVGRL